MQNQETETMTPDELEPIELGAVSEETRGGFYQGTELAVGPNSRI